MHVKKNRPCSRNMNSDCYSSWWNDQPRLVYLRKEANLIWYWLNLKTCNSCKSMLLSTPNFITITTTTAEYYLQILPDATSPTSELATVPAHNACCTCVIQGEPLYYTERIFLSPSFDAVCQRAIEKYSHVLSRCSKRSERENRISWHLVVQRNSSFVFLPFLVREATWSVIAHYNLRVKKIWHEAFFK